MDAIVKPSLGASIPSDFVWPKFVPVDSLVPGENQSHEHSDCEILTARTLIGEERARLKKFFPNAHYLIISGEHLWAAAKTGGMKMVKVWVRKCDFETTPIPKQTPEKVTSLKPSKVPIRRTPPPAPKMFLQQHIISAMPPPRKESPPSPRRKEWTVNCWDTRILRIVSDVVGPEKYIKLWDGKLLEFQRNKKPKPGHLPTREEAEAMFG